MGRERKDCRNVTAAKLTLHLTLMLGLAVICSMAAVSAEAPSAKLLPNKLLKGKVEDHNRVTRLPRPALPAVATTSDGPNLKGKIDGILSDINSDDAKFGAKQEEPSFSGGQSVGASPGKTLNLRGGADRADSKEMLIAWERWHHRVCGAMFERWDHNATLRGRVETKITVTRDLHIKVEILHSGLAPEELDRLPPDNLSYRAQQERLLVSQVTSSIYALEGQSVLTFPDGSRRQKVVLEKNFNAGDDEGYEWKHDDYEHVQAR